MKVTTVHHYSLGALIKIKIFPLHSAPASNRHNQLLSRAFFHLDIIPFFDNYLLNELLITYLIVYITNVNKGICLFNI